MMSHFCMKRCDKRELEVWKRQFLFDITYERFLKLFCIISHLLTTFKRKCIHRNFNQRYKLVDTNGCDTKSHTIHKCNNKKCSKCTVILTESMYPFQLFFYTNLLHYILKMRYYKANIFLIQFVWALHRTIYFYYTKRPISHFASSSFFIAVRNDVKSTYFHMHRNCRRHPPLQHPTLIHSLYENVTEIGIHTVGICNIQQKKKKKKEEWSTLVSFYTLYII